MVLAAPSHGMMLMVVPPGSPAPIRKEAPLPMSSWLAAARVVLETKAVAPAPRCSVVTFSVVPAVVLAALMFTWL